jgi:hypothetical protein
VGTLGPGLVFGLSPIPTALRLDVITTDVTPVAWQLSLAAGQPWPIPFSPCGRLRSVGAPRAGCAEHSSKRNGSLADLPHETGLLEGPTPPIVTVHVGDMNHSATHLTRTSTANQPPRGVQPIKSAGLAHGNAYSAVRLTEVSASFKIEVPQ